ncbi:hypothetical protein FGO68_gene1209 [Halteria grandinella]|uniref:Uncharacterized protein n=1 Tax=Halteria grandinella TaxID=5974 RepID=A0A8J8T1P2_HALGN|nr:hypothetical protein FGO68_gene1209 [Halteria grandinella]
MRQGVFNMQNAQLLSCGNGLSANNWTQDPPLIKEEQVRRSAWRRLFRASPPGQRIFAIVLLMNWLIHREGKPAFLGLICASSQLFIINIE